MNFKRVGFLTGALIAGVAVYAFYAITEVSDDDRLTDILSDHCLPYVMTGQTPFQDLGRRPGVYDDVTPRDDLEAGGTRIMHDNRFVAEWGILSDNGRSVRLCDVKPTYSAATIAAFEVEPQGFLTRYGALMPGLTAELDVIETGPTILGWYGSDRAQDDGLRVVMVVSPGLVSSILAVDDLED